MTPVTHDDAAKRLVCSKRTIRTLVREGRLQPAPRFGRQAVVTLESIEALLNPKPRPVPERRAPKAIPPRRTADADDDITWADIEARLKEAKR